MILSRHAQLLEEEENSMPVCQNKIKLKVLNEVLHEPHIDTLSDKL